MQALPESRGAYTSTDLHLFDKHIQTVRDAHAISKVL